MRRPIATTGCIFLGILSIGSLSHGATSAPTNLSMQEDGSLVVFDAKGGVAEFVKQGTPRQSIQLDGQACNVSYGFNSAGKQTILVSLPPSATGPVVFLLGESQITIPTKAALRITLNESHKIEKMVEHLPARFNSKSFRLLPPERKPSHRPPHNSPPFLPLLKSPRLLLPPKPQPPPQRPTQWWDK